MFVLRIQSVFAEPLKMIPVGSISSHLFNKILQNIKRTMKIITFKYNRQESAICTSTLMADEEYAWKNVYRLAPRPDGHENNHEVQSQKRAREYAVSGTWQ